MNEAYRLRLFMMPRSASGWLCRRQRPNSPTATMMSPLSVSVAVRPMSSASHPDSRPPIGAVPANDML